MPFTNEQIVVWFLSNGEEHFGHLQEYYDILCQLPFAQRMEQDALLPKPVGVYDYMQFEEVMDFCHATVIPLIHSLTTLSDAIYRANKYREEPRICLCDTGGIAVDMFGPFCTIAINADDVFNKALEIQRELRDVANCERLHSFNITSVKIFGRGDDTVHRTWTLYRKLWRKTLLWAKVLSIVAYLTELSVRPRGAGAERAKKNFQDMCADEKEHDVNDGRKRAKV